MSESSIALASVILLKKFHLPEFYIITIQHSIVELGKLKENHLLLFSRIIMCMLIVP